MSKRLSLSAYADANPIRPVTCWLCKLPERAEVEAAAAAGVPKSVILRWLKQECGYTEATDNRVDGHLKNHAQTAS